jgi:hypothetical protein
MRPLIRDTLSYSARGPERISYDEGLSPTVFCVYMSIAGLTACIQLTQSTASFLYLAAIIYDLIYFVKSFLFAKKEREQARSESSPLVPEERELLNLS